MRRLILPALIGALALTASPATPGPGGPRPRGLSAGDAEFWKGAFVDQASGDCDAGACWEYHIAVLERGYRLRVGIDHPKVGDDFSMTVTGPSGQRSTVSTGTGLYSAESLHPRPELGAWTIQVRADNVDDSAFRVRAKLEARKPRLGTKRGPVPPNLQILPPHEASFLMPLTNGSQGDPPQGVPGGDSCHAEERAEGALRCLRFAYGLRNTGRGPLQLYFDGAPPTDYPLFQRVQRGNDTYFDRDAGTAVWHESHGHYHHGDAVELQLFAVEDADTGELSPASERQRKGFAHRDELLRDWKRFYPTWPRFGFGLLAGWSDIYEWDRPGNYVDFGVNGDGEYVVRMWADPDNGILESNERDNLGYTYFRVTGTDVELLEAGRGKHPWDPCKIVVGFGGHPDPAPERPRPDRCPRDTT